jgi:hypothetical protein
MTEDVSEFRDDRRPDQVPVDVNAETGTLGSTDKAVAVDADRLGELIGQVFEVDQ